MLLKFYDIVIVFFLDGESDSDIDICKLLFRICYVSYYRNLFYVSYYKICRNLIYVI